MRSGTYADYFDPIYDEDPYESEQIDDLNSEIADLEKQLAEQENLLCDLYEKAELLQDAQEEVERLRDELDAVYRTLERYTASTITDTLLDELAAGIEQAIYPPQGE